MQKRAKSKAFEKEIGSSCFLWDACNFHSVSLALWCLSFPLLSFREMPSVFDALTKRTIENAILDLAPNAADARMPYVTDDHLILSATL